MQTHIASVRSRRIAWDVREVVQHGLNADRVELSLDDEWRACDRIVAVLAGAGDPVRILVEGGGFNLPSSLMERTGAIRMCLIGYVRESARIVTAKEAAPLVVVESGDIAGIDPAPEQPDLWATLMEEVRRATEGADAAAQSATRAEADLRAAAERGDFDGEDGKTPVRGVDYWTAEDRKPIEDATLDATTAAGKADAAAEKASVGETSRAASEAERVADEAERVEAESGRKSAEATRAANETKRTESFNTNLVSWNSKVDAACKKATDTASKAAQDAKTATDAAIAKTEEATQAAVAKADKATASATTAANKAEAAVSKLPLPLGNTLKGKVEATLVNVDDAYPAPLVTTKVMGQSNQQQEPAPSPENPQEITNLNKAELVITGKNLLKVKDVLENSTGLSIQRGDDGTLTVNGEITTDKYLTLLDGSEGYLIPQGTLVTLSGAPENIAFTIGSRPSVGTSTSISGSLISCANCNSGTGKIADGTRVIFANLRFAAGRYSGVVVRPQIEAGSKATAYEPTLKPKATSIDLKGNELCSLPNGVKDEVVIDSEGNVSLIKRVGLINPDTSWEWVTVEVLDGTHRYQVACVAEETELAENAECVSDISVRCTMDDTMNSKDGCAVQGIENSNYIAVYITSLANGTVDDFKAWLTEHPISVYYKLLTPQTIPLGKVELPALPESTSNVWNDGNIPANVYINYLKDVNIAFADLESKLTQAVVAAASNI